MEQKSLCIIVSRKHLLITTILVLLFMALGGTAYAMTLEQRVKRLNRYKDWYKNNDKAIIPLRIDWVKSLGNNKRQREQKIKEKYGGWYRRKKKVNGKTVYVYFVATDKSWYRNYFYTRRWSHLSKSEQDRLWEKRMKESTYIKMRIQRWCNKEEQKIQNLMPPASSGSAPLTASYDDLQGSWFMHTNLNWLITVDLHGGSRTANVKFYHKASKHAYPRGYSYGGQCTATFVKNRRFMNNFGWDVQDVLEGVMTWVKWKNGRPQPATSFVRMWIRDYVGKPPRIPRMAFRIMRPPWKLNPKWGPLDGTGGPDITTWDGNYARRADSHNDPKKWWPASRF